MKNKETLFSKNSYDDQIEEILDKKEFNDEAKTMILSILYKIEESYKNYSKIKLNVKNKNDIIEEIVNIIQNKCDKIEFFDPKITKNKLQVDKKNKLIKAFPNEECLLQALYYINTESIKNVNNIFEKAVIDAINKGNAISNVEVIRDFNGWSWNSAIDGNMNRYYNIIFQDLLILIGNSGTIEIGNSNNIIENINNQISEIYGEKIAQKFMYTLEKVSMLLYINSHPKHLNEIKEYSKNQKEKYAKITNKSAYISEITEKNSKNLSDIGKIDNILGNNKLLIKKFNNPKIKEKFETIEKYKKALEKSKQIKSKELNENSKLINPFEYIKVKNKLKTEVQILNDIDVLSKKNDAIYQTLIQLQKMVISSLYKKIEIYDLKKELMNLIYEIRYFNLLPIYDDLKIKDVKLLSLDLRNMQEKLTNKLCENKILDIFAKDYKINYKIIKYLYNSKIININKLQVLIKYQSKKLILMYYEDNSIEYQEKILFSKDDLEELTKKMNKKMKIII